MERRLGIAILAAVITFTILDTYIGTAGFKPTSTLMPHQIDPATLRQNAAIYSAEAAFFVMSIVLIFSKAFSSGESEETSAEASKVSQNSSEQPSHRPTPSGVGTH